MVRSYSTFGQQCIFCGGVNGNKGQLIAIDRKTGTWHMTWKANSYLQLKHGGIPTASIQSAKSKDIYIRFKKRTDQL